jgi:hypothetical protein
LLLFKLSCRTKPLFYFAWHHDSRRCRRETVSQSDGNAVLINYLFVQSKSLF